MGGGRGEGVNPRPANTHSARGHMAERGHVYPPPLARGSDTCTLHTSLGARWTQIFTTNQRNTVDRNSKILMFAVSCSPGSDRDWTPGCLHSR